MGAAGDIVRMTVSRGIGSGDNGLQCAVEGCTEPFADGWTCCLGGS